MEELICDMSGNEKAICAEKSHEIIQQEAVDTLCPSAMMLQICMYKPYINI